MHNITVDLDTLSRLGGLQVPVKLVDGTGRVLGYVTPAEDASVYAGLDPGVSEAELEAREGIKAERSLDDILSDLSAKD